MGRAPSFFISHGAPMFAVEPDALSDYLTALGSSLAHINAVLLISPHWQTPDLCVMTTPDPATIHDFSGFPEVLYTLQYPAKGSPEWAKQLVQLMGEQGVVVREDAGRGLDHGAWVPLMYLFPKANVPVFQLSMPVGLTAGSALQLGVALRSLRDRGVLMLGSGGFTHNLYEIAPKNSVPEGYIKLFGDWMREAVVARDFERLANYRKLAPHAERAHPTDEHLLPLLVALGASFDEDPLHIESGDIYYGMLSMESYFWGLAG